MNSRSRMMAMVVGTLVAVAVASSAHAANNCGNVPPRDGTGQQLGRRNAARVSMVSTLKLAWRYALPLQLTGFGWGPGDGTGFGGDGPLDGTGYGPGGGEAIGICDGTGPNGTITRRGR